MTIQTTNSYFNRTNSHNGFPPTENPYTPPENRFTPSANSYPPSYPAPIISHQSLQKSFIDFLPEKIILKIVNFLPGRDLVSFLSAFIHCKNLGDIRLILIFQKKSNMEDWKIWPQLNISDSLDAEANFLIRKISKYYRVVQFNGIELKSNWIGINSLGSVNALVFPKTTTTILHLENVSLQGDVAIVLAAILKSSRINNLFLHCFNLGKEGAIAIGSALAVSSVRFLNIRFAEDSLTYVIPALDKMPRIKYLVIGSYLPFSEISCIQLFHQLKKSKIGYVSFWNVSLEAQKVICAELPHSPRVTELKIANTRFTSDSFQSLLLAVELAPGLLFLNLSDNHLNDSAADVIANSIPQTRLKALVLNNNDITMNGCAKIVCASLKRLSKLFLESNLINEQFRNAMLYKAMKDNLQLMI